MYYECSAKFLPGTDLPDNVTGDCGHKHRTLNGALKCLRHHRSGCAAQGGYSDRSIFQVDENGRTRVDGFWETGRNV